MELSQISENLVTFYLFTMIASMRHILSLPKILLHQTGEKSYTKIKKKGTDSYINVFVQSQKTTIPFSEYKKP